MCVRESAGVLMCFSERLQHNYSEISGSVFWLIKPESLQDMNETRRGNRGGREQTEERHAAHFYNPEQYIYAVLNSGLKQSIKKESQIDDSAVSSPATWTLLLITRFTWPVRAAPCIRSMTYLCGFPTTGIPSTNSSSSPGRRRPSRSAGLFSMIAPMRICF